MCYGERVTPASFLSTSFVVDAVLLGSDLMSSFSIPDVNLPLRVNTHTSSGCIVPPRVTTSSPIEPMPPSHPNRIRHNLQIQGGEQVQTSCHVTHAPSCRWLQYSRYSLRAPAPGGKNIWVETTCLTRYGIPCGTNLQGSWCQRDTGPPIQYIAPPITVRV
jgi:hypothetical protein